MSGETTALLSEVVVTQPGYGTAAMMRDEDRFPGLFKAIMDLADKEFNRILKLYNNKILLSQLVDEIKKMNFYRVSLYYFPDNMPLHERFNYCHKVAFIYSVCCLESYIQPDQEEVTQLAKVMHQGLQSTEAGPSSAALALETTKDSRRKIIHKSDTAFSLTDADFPNLESLFNYYIDNKKQLSPEAFKAIRDVADRQFHDFDLKKNREFFILVLEGGVSLGYVADQVSNMSFYHILDLLPAHMKLNEKLSLCYKTAFIYSVLSFDKNIDFKDENIIDFSESKFTFSENFLPYYMMLNVMGFIYRLPYELVMLATLVILPFNWNLRNLSDIFDKLFSNNNFSTGETALLTIYILLMIIAFIPLAVEHKYNDVSLFEIFIPVFLLFYTITAKWFVPGISNRLGRGHSESGEEVDTYDIINRMNSAHHSMKKHFQNAFSSLSIESPSEIVNQLVKYTYFLNEVAEAIDELPDEVQERLRDPTSYNLIKGEVVPRINAEGKIINYQDKDQLIRVTRNKIRSTDAYIQNANRIREDTLIIEPRHRNNEKYYFDGFTGKFQEYPSSKIIEQYTLQYRKEVIIALHGKLDLKPFSFLKGWSEAYDAGIAELHNGPKASAESAETPTPTKELPESPDESAMPTAAYSKIQ